MEEEELIRQAMTALGKRTSERKKETSALNGKKGGRPKGVPMSEETKAKIAATRKRNQEEDFRRVTEQEETARISDGYPTP